MVEREEKSEALFPSAFTPLRQRIRVLMARGPNPLPLRGERQRGTVIREKRNNASVVEHCSPGIVHGVL
jgi:hypothetical protein